MLDEPTAALHRGEPLRLLGAVRGQAGRAVLFISHRLEEVTALADRIIVLRDGRVAGEVGRRSFDQANLVRIIVGTQQLESGSLRVNSWRPGAAVLTARGIVGAGVKGVDLGWRSAQRGPDVPCSPRRPASALTRPAGEAGRLAVLLASAGSDFMTDSAMAIDGGARPPPLALIEFPSRRMFRGVSLLSAELWLASWP